MRNLIRTLISMLGAVLLSVAAHAVPAVTVAPAVGPPTSKTTVSGTGFGAFAAIDIYYDTAHLCLSFANAAGAASCIITVPKDAQPQFHWVSMLQRSNGTGAQKSHLVRTDMPQFHGRNATHNGVNPFENTINTVNAGDLDVLWVKPIGPTGSRGSPVVAAGIVYAGGTNGNLHAFNATTGNTVAGFPVATGGAIVFSTPAVGGGRVFIGADDSKLHAYNAANGAAVAGFPKTLGGIVWSSPALALGNVYVGANDGKLYAFNATTGAAVPGFPVTLGVANDVLGSPAVFNGKVYIGSANSNLFGFDALTGVAVLGFPKGTGGIIYSTVAAASGMGFFGSADNNLYGIRLSIGANLGGFPAATGGVVFSSPAVAGGKVFVGSDDLNVYAYFTSGGFAWSSLLDSLPRGSPMAANGVLYVNSVQRVYALSAASGAKLWSAAALSGTGLNSPVVANGMVYFASDDGNLYAYSVNGLSPASALPGGALGVKPALSALKPDLSLKPR